MTDTILARRILPRFTRAAHLQRDFADVRLGLSGYQVTPLVLQTTARIMDSLAPNVNDRAFSVIGPYGAGKSAFAVFIASYLSYSRQAREAIARDHSTVSFPDAHVLDGPRLLPVLVGGNSGPLRLAIVRALREAWVQEPRLRAADQTLLHALDTALDDAALDPQAVADVVERVANLVRRAQVADGAVLVIDELGQYLHYAARYDERDLYVLQNLAEMAARSHQAPCLVLTILHQSFDRYTGAIGGSRAADWAKVQGRFIELPFEEPGVQLLRMVARALWPDEERPPAWQRDWAIHMTAMTEQLELRPPEISRTEWCDLLSRTYPLHPTVLLALPMLFRQLAQNERSLFAFLSALEPWGLQDFLARSGVAEGQRPPIYRLPTLYRYVEATLGASLFGRARGQRWAELAEAREQLGDGAGLAFDTLTTIGTLGALGQYRGLRADRDRLAFALMDDPHEPQMATALSLLDQRRMIVYRAYRQSYRLWEGSDLDLNDLAAAARREIAGRVALSDLLASHAAEAPLVARRFSYETGAMRVFTARFVDAFALPEIYSRPEGADGEALYVVAQDSEALALAETWATSPARSAEPLRIVVLPVRVEDLRDLALDVAALDYLLHHQSELEHDGAARREVAARHVEARQALGALLTETYSAGGRWFWCGLQQPTNDSREIDDLLSRACATAFSQTPRVWNELLVRRQLSSAAARARRILIAAMLDHSSEGQLGFRGFPPERAMYESLFAAGGLHRQEPDGSWSFGPPPEDDPLGLAPTWQTIEAFFDSTVDRPRPLLDLYHQLEAPPFGIKAGLLPLLFMAVYLANSGELALYEHGNFVPTPDIALFERVLRQPSYIAIRCTPVTGVRFAVYERLARAMAPQALRGPRPALMTAVAPLLRFVQALPPYARGTRELSQRALDVRQALLSARAPDELLFESLPLACGMSPFSPETATDPALVEQFFTYLRGGLEELRAAYPKLLDLIATRIAAAFIAASSESGTLRDELLVRYRAVAEATSDNQIRALGVRLEHGAPDGWLASVAALVAHKPPEAWDDADSQNFAVRIFDLGRRFRLAEQLTLAAGRTATDVPLLRVGIADAQGERSVILHTHNLTPDVHQLRKALSNTLAQYQGVTHAQRTIAVAEILRDLLTKDEEEA